MRQRDDKVRKSILNLRMNPLVNYILALCVLVLVVLCFLSIRSIGF